MSQELELLKAELAIKGKQAGTGAGLFGGAGVFGLFAFGALTAALTGKKKVEQALPPVPHDSVEGVKEDVQWTKTSAQRGRR